MRLDAARKERLRVEASIKDALLDHVARLANRQPGGAWRKSKPAVPLLAVGIAAGPSASDYRAAVRISRHGYRIDLLNAMLQRHHHGAVDVRYIGRVFPVGTSPIVVRSSTSVSHYLTGTGTLGCPVRDRQTGAASLLSNNHVIGFENDAVVGDPVIEPGHDDGGSAPGDAIASYVRCVNLDFSGAPNTVDAALAALAPGVQVLPPAAPGYAYDPTMPPVAASKVSLVRKLGRSSGLTTGMVTGVEMGGFWVDYQNGPALFDHQIEVTGIDGPFATHGDSGALVVDERGAAVGLLFAVSETGVAYINPMGMVLDQLGADLA